MKCIQLKSNFLSVFQLSVFQSFKLLKPPSEDYVGKFWIRSSEDIGQL